MARTCTDCLFCILNSNDYSNSYCNLHDKTVDDEQFACSKFISDSHDCCYDCAGRKDTLFGGFRCTILNKGISNAAHYVCSRFRY